VSYLLQAALAVVAGLALSCSGGRTASPGEADAASPPNGAEGGANPASPSDTSIDGTWDIIFTGYHAYTGGTLVVSGTSAQAILALTEEGTAQGTNCTYTQSKDEIDLALMPSSVLGTNVHLQQLDGTGCPANQSPGTVVRHPQSNSDLAARESTTPSAFGSIGGAWNATSPRGSCQVTFAGKIMSGTCSDGMTFTGTRNGNDVSGQSSEGFEFAAHRR
jgi:hypothetical protein